MQIQRNLLRYLAQLKAWCWGSFIRQCSENTTSHRDAHDSNWFNPFIFPVCEHYLPSLSLVPFLLSSCCASPRTAVATLNPHQYLKTARRSLLSILYHSSSHTAIPLFQDSDQCIYVSITMRTQNWTVHSREMSLLRNI